MGADGRIEWPLTVLIECVIQLVVPESIGHHPLSSSSSLALLVSITEQQQQLESTRDRAK